MSGKTYGYVRLSTKNRDRDADSQTAALRAYGVAESAIIVENAPETGPDRPLYRELLDRLQAGDVLVIRSLGCLGKSYEDIQEQWRILRKERGVTIVVLDIPVLCTNENQEPFNDLITDIVLQFFSFVVKREREKARAHHRRK